ncbi:response regulator [bacterium]|nr:response regulator [bacterium]
MKFISKDVLLIEDDIDHRELIVNEIKRDKELVSTIYSVGDGQEALDFLFRKGKYKTMNKSFALGFIILDVRLPKMSGIEVLKRIKLDEQLKTVPVVILTSSSHQQDMVQAYANYVNSYIIKPVKFEDFIDKIKKMIFYWNSINSLPPK